jgi:NADP-dependent 3-hydroxy acid dehydrogenase YdfG
MLARAGLPITLLGRDHERLRGTLQACQTFGSNYVSLSADLTSPAEAIKAVASAQVFGPPRILIHAAGLFDWAPADQADPEVWASLVEVNLIAAMRFTRLMLPLLSTYPGSAVVFIASMAGQGYFANNAAYVASKHGLVAFARSVFLDMRDRGVKVSVISPGVVAAGASLTLPEHMHQKFLRPEDVAEAVAYVLSTSSAACPIEILLEPQHDPWHRSSGNGSHAPVL